MTTYTPQPINTSDVIFPVDLVPLIEKLAEHNHDHWSLRRISEGWSWGPELDKQSKTHPDLVPYVDLPEAEKEYDRVTSTEAIKAILALGFSVEKREASAS